MSCGNFDALIIPGYSRSGVLLYTRVGNSAIVDCGTNEVSAMNTTTRYSALYCSPRQCLAGANDNDAAFHRNLSMLGGCQLCPISKKWIQDRPTPFRYAIYLLDVFDPIQHTFNGPIYQVLIQPFCTYLAKTSIALRHPEYQQSGDEVLRPREEVRYQTFPRLYRFQSSRPQTCGLESERTLLGVLGRHLLNKVYRFEDERTIQNVSGIVKTSP